MSKYARQSEKKRSTDAGGDEDDTSMQRCEVKIVSADEHVNKYFSDNLFFFLVTFFKWIKYFCAIVV